MKNTLEKIREAFTPLDGNNLKEDDSLIIIAHTNDGDLTALAGKGVGLAALLAMAMDKNSDFAEVVRLGLWALEQNRKQNGQPKDEENEAENKK